MSNFYILFGWRDLVSVAAAMLGLSAYLRQSQKLLKFQMGLASQVWAVYFFLLGLTTAGLIQLGTGIRT